MEDVAFHRHLESLKAANRPFSDEEELEYYHLIQNDIQEEQDSEVKEFMNDMLKFYLNETCMNLKYFYDEFWKPDTEQARKNLEDLYPIDVFKYLENILARQSDSMEYTKFHETKRYPLWVPRTHSCELDKLNNIPRHLSRFRLIKSYYKFGTHRYHVGRAIEQALSALEERYGLNFKELEQIYQTKNAPNKPR